MRYNEVLLALYGVIEKVNKKKDNNYKKSKLFDDLKELLYLEKVCEDYFLKINELSEEETKTFNSFAVLDGNLRRKIKEEYKKAYLDGKIKNSFKEEYDNITDCVVAILLNELDNELFSYDFVNLFNDNIKNIYINDKVLNYFKENSIYYKKLYSKDENISKDFKLVLKEFQLLSYVYKKNNIYGVALYNLIDSNISNTNGILSIIKNDNNFNKIDSITELILKLESDSNDLFSNYYSSIVLDITESKSIFNYIIKNSDKGFSIVIGIILNKLLDKKFLNSILINERHLNPKILSDILNEIHKRNLKVNYNLVNPFSLLNYYDSIDDILEEIKNNKDNKKI